MFILVDYLSVSAPYKYINDFRNMFLFNKVSVDVGKGAYGYNTQDYYNSMHLYYRGNNDTCFVSLTGQGCRTFETLYKDTYGVDLDWEKFLVGFLYYDDFHVTRLDLAVDDRDDTKYLNMLNVLRFTQHKRWVSRICHYTWTGGSEEIIRFGSPQSEYRLRIYNKALERGYIDDTHWIRVEQQFRDDCAYSVLRYLERGLTIGEVFASELARVRYTVQRPGVGNRRPRDCDTVKWWDKFLQGASRLPLIRPVGVEYNVHQLQRYLEQGCASSIKTWIELHGGDLEPLLNLTLNAVFNDKQKLLLRQYSLGEGNACIKTE